MATQFITLEEAARRLGIPAEEFKRRLKTEWTNIVPMRDGPNLRFRENQIEELARQMGAASDPGLPLGALDGSDPGSDDFKIGSTGPKTGKIPRAGAAPKPADDPLSFDGSDDDIFSLSAEPAKGGKPADKSHDSDVRLEPPKPPKDGSQGIPTEEIALDLGGGPGSAVIKGGSSAKLSAPKSSANLSVGDAGKKLSSESGRNLGKNMGDSSEFELSLDADSDDFELQVQSDSSEEVDLGSSPLDEGGRAGRSGVNLRKPADSGIPLDKGRGTSSARKLDPPKPPVDDSDDFELSLEADSDEAKALTGPRSSPKVPVTSDSDSEFELTLDDSSEGGSLGSLEAAALADDDAKGDIFETDFEIPPMSDESGSEAVALESDTDLEAGSDDVALDDVDVVADDDSGSEAVVLDEEDEDRPRVRRGAADALDDDDEEGGSASSALAGVRGRRRGSDEDDEDDEDAEPAGKYAPPTPWGVFPALVLFPTLLLLVIGGLMGYELLNTMNGYAQPRKPSAPIVRGIAKQLDKELRDQ